MRNTLSRGNSLPHRVISTTRPSLSQPADGARACLFDARFCSLISVHGAWRRRISLLRLGLSRLSRGFWCGCRGRARSQKKKLKFAPTALNQAAGLDGIALCPRAALRLLDHTADGPRPTGELARDGLVRPARVHAPLLERPPPRDQPPLSFERVPSHRLVDGLARRELLGVLGDVAVVPGRLHEQPSDMLVPGLRNRPAGVLFGALALGGDESEPGGEDARALEPGELAGLCGKVERHDDVDPLHAPQGVEARLLGDGVLDAVDVVEQGLAGCLVGKLDGADPAQKTAVRFFLLAPVGVLSSKQMYSSMAKPTFRRVGFRHFADVRRPPS